MNLIAFVEGLFDQYAYLVLLLGLPLDFIALPIPPGNSTLTYTGYLAYKGTLSLWPSLAAALGGAWIGVTVTYGIGRLAGMPLLNRYGKYLFIKPSFVERIQRYYEKHGNRMLLFLFFVPGIRQFIGYFIGVLRVPYRAVLLYAYPGAALWVLFFFAIGYGFGEQWTLVLNVVERYLIYVSAGAALIVIGVLLFRKWRRAPRKNRRPSRKAKKAEPAEEA